jgi:hypothetical protein
LPAPRKETSRPASEPMPAPTTAIMRRFDIAGILVRRAGSYCAVHVPMVCHPLLTLVSASYA